MSNRMVGLQASEGPKERILEGALRVFAERGIQLATLREITDRVDVNLAAVNYYYGSKNELVRAVLRRYVRPIVDGRLEALELLEMSEQISLREVVEALVRPMVRLSRDKWGGRSVVLLLLQIRAVSTPEFQDLASELFDPITHRFVDAFMRAEAKLSRASAYWRYNFALGTIMQILTDTNPAALRLEFLSAGLCKSDDKIIAAELVTFITAGMGADSRKDHSKPSQAARPRKRETSK